MALLQGLQGIQELLRLRSCRFVLPSLYRLLSCLQCRGLRRGSSSVWEPQGLCGRRLAVRGVLHIQL
jgi:hypothetical protein